jgi:hypothetical protein
MPCIELKCVYIILRRVQVKNSTKKAIITRELLRRTQVTRDRALHTIYRMAW